MQITSEANESILRAREYALRYAQFNLAAACA